MGTDVVFKNILIARDLRSDTYRAGCFAVGSMEIKGVDETVFAGPDKRIRLAVDDR